MSDRRAQIDRWIEQGAIGEAHDKGVRLAESSEGLHQLRINYRAGDMWAPHLDSTEALKLEVQEFVSAIQGGHQPLTNGQAGLKVVRVLETATASMALRGQVLEIPTGALA